MENIKEINIKNRTYYFFDDMINIENFNLVLLKKTKSHTMELHSKTLTFITLDILQRKILNM